MSSWVSCGLETKKLTSEKVTDPPACGGRSVSRGSPGQLDPLMGQIMPGDLAELQVWGPPLNFSHYSYFRFSSDFHIICQ